MKVIIAGSRGITDYSVLEKAIEQVEFPITQVVSGTARGVDQLGEQWAHTNHIHVERFPADWNKYGRSAGYRRNQQMADYADGLIALWDGVSRGTGHMITIAKMKGLQVVVFDQYGRRLHV
jgi:hypothetical protein